MSFQHRDIVEEPGTYLSNFAAALGILAGAGAIALGAFLIGPATGLAWSTIAVGALTAGLMAGRLWIGWARWASQVVLVLGVYSWYAPHAFGIHPNVFTQGQLGICWAEVGVGLALVFIGTWTALGAPGRIEHDRFFYPVER